jgi:hypothetical protein
MDVPSFSGAEERKPDDAQDQDRKAGGDRQQREHRRSGLGLSRLGRGLNDLTFSLRCHGSLNLHRSPARESNAQFPIMFRPSAGRDRASRLDHAARYLQPKRG